MEKDSKIYVAGHMGLVGSAIVRELKRQGHTNIIVRTSAELDLRNQSKTFDFFEKNKPEYVFLAAAKVGGIKANMTFPAEFIYDNLQIELNVVEASKAHNVKKMIFLSSNCVYPVNAEKPYREESLFSGQVEPTNEPYAIAKLTGMKLCQAYNAQHSTNFISILPANLYGPNDNFDPNNSHFVPSLIRKFHEAKINKSDKVIVWGTGKPRRELMHVDDAAKACIFLMKNYDSSIPLNAGVGKDYTILEIAELVKEMVGFEGDIELDKSKPDGIFSKLLDSTKIHKLGWKPEIGLKEGLASTYKWYLENF